MYIPPRAEPKEYMYMYMKPEGGIYTLPYYTYMDSVFASTKQNKHKKASLCYMGNVPTHDVFDFQRK